jgi:hypothetical protein
MSVPGEEIRAAVAELRSIRSTDPCASIAIATVKATIHTLETRWLAAAPSERSRADDESV